MGLSIYKIEYEFVSGCSYGLLEWLDEQGYINENGKLYLNKKDKVIQGIQEDKRIKKGDKLYWINIINNLEEDRDYEIF